METVFFLKFYGSFMFLFGLAFCISKESRLGIIELQKNNIIILGFFSLLIGITTVIFHNLYEGPWQICITVLGYMTVLKGFVRILNLPKTKERNSKITEKALKISGFFVLLFGLILLYGAAVL